MNASSQSSSHLPAPDDASSGMDESSHDIVLPSLKTSKSPSSMEPEKWPEISSSPEEVSAGKFPQDQMSSRVCLYCGVDPDDFEKDWAKTLVNLHHPFFSSKKVLTEASRGGCPACSLMLDAICTHTKDFLQSEDAKCTMFFYLDKSLLFLDLILQIFSRQTGNVEPLSGKASKESVWIEKGLQDAEPSVRVIQLNVLHLQAGSCMLDSRSHVNSSLPSQDTASPRTIDTLISWIKICDSQHAKCRTNQLQPLPSRILRISDTSVFLEGSLGRHTEYACLSHCWGPDGPALQLKSSTANILQEGVNINDLPKTFENAVRLCHKLGIMYLWIDALCIFQDNPLDWSVESSMMGRIYQNSYITIAATCASDSNSGLFRKTKEPFRYKQMSNPGFWVRQQLPRFPITFMHDIADWPLLSRAWVFQERKLSTRTVHFGSQQIYWECKSNVVSEDGSIAHDCTKEPEHDNVAVMPFVHELEDVVLSWQKDITHYSDLKLTYESDRLPAIAARAEQMMHLRKDDIYVAGMWKSSLLQDLCWSSGDSFESSRPNRRVPSWSWASVKFKVDWEVCDILPTVELIDMTFTAVGPPQSGDSRDAVIVLRGPLLKTKFIKNGSWNDACLDCTFRHARIADSIPYISEYFWLDFDYSKTQSPIVSARNVDVLLLGRNTVYLIGIVLHKLSDTKYERIGLARFRRGESEYGGYERLPPVQQVRIV